MKYVRKKALASRLKAFACVCLLAASQSLLAAPADREAVYTEARGYLQSGEAEKAYQLLLENELEWSGEDAYDYLLGVAALDSGESGEAIFSLQRLVARKPDFAGARMELARAYFEIGDNELARKEFTRIMSEDPPPNVIAASNDYLTAIDARARQYKSDVLYAFDFGFGYDSNAPAATADDVFLNLMLSPNNLEQSSSFANSSFGAVYNRPLGPETQLLLNASMDHRINPSTHFVDASNVDLGIGWTFSRGGNMFSVSANRVFSWLDRDKNKNDTGVNLTYSRKLNDTWNLMAFFRASELRFEEAALEVQDVDRLSYGLTVSQTFTSAVMNLTFSGGGDDAQQSASPFSTDTYGVNLSNSWYRPGGKIYFVEAGFSSTEYDDPFFSIDRDDDLLSFAVGGTWSKFPHDDWSTTFRAGYSEKDSTVSLYEFDRLEVGFTLQKLF